MVTVTSSKFHPVYSLLPSFFSVAFSAIFEAVSRKTHLAATACSNGEIAPDPIGALAELSLCLHLPCVVCAPPVGQVPLFKSFFWYHFIRFSGFGYLYRDLVIIHPGPILCIGLELASLLEIAPSTTFPTSESGVRGTSWGSGILGQGCTLFRRQWVPNAISI